MKTRHKVVPAVYLIIRNKEGEILLMLRQNTGYQDGNYVVPSGHVEEGELPKAAMIREAKEEIGIDLGLEELEFAHVSSRPAHDETGDRVDFFFLAKTWSGEVVNMEPHKCAELKWIKPTDLPENTTPHVREIIKLIGEGVNYSELGADWIKANGAWQLPE